MSLTNLDFVVLACYAVLLFCVALYVSREPKGTVKTTEDYFLAGKSLPWWAIGASLIAANISAEQIIVDDDVYDWRRVCDRRFWASLYRAS